MQEKHLYEYAVIRIVPVIAREEFVNVGIIIFCKREKFIKVLFTIDKVKLGIFCNEMDLQQVESNLQSFEKIAHGNVNGGPIASFDLPSRFRWLTAIRSSAIQTSRPHPGLSTDLEKTASRLFFELVL